MEYMKLLNVVAYQNAMVKQAGLNKEALFGIGGDDVAKALKKLFTRSKGNGLKAAPDLYVSSGQKAARRPMQGELERMERQSKNYFENAKNFHQKNNKYFGYKATNFGGGDQWFMKYPNGTEWFPIDKAQANAIQHADNVMQEGISAAAGQAAGMTASPYRNVELRGAKWLDGKGIPSEPSKIKIVPVEK